MSDSNLAFDFSGLSENYSQTEHEIDTHFRAFHRDNPSVFRLFCKFTLEVISRGFMHYSAKGVLERVRWETSLETVDPGAFEPEGRPLKINNNYSSRYARLFMQKYPQYEGFFRTRELRS